MLAISACDMTWCKAFIRADFNMDARTRTGWDEVIALMEVGSETWDWWEDSPGLLLRVMRVDEFVWQFYELMVMLDR